MSKPTKILSFLSISLFFFSPGICLSPLAKSEQVRIQDRKIREQNKKTAEEYFVLVQEAYQKRKYQSVVKYASELEALHPHSPLLSETLFLEAVALYRLKDYDFANEAFSAYLNQGQHLAHFDDVVQYKFDIAQQYEKGAKRRMLGVRGMPKVMSDRHYAIGVYDEIINILPRQDLAAQALYKKGKLLSKLTQYNDSIEIFQVLIKRYPKHPLTPESYLEIGRIYEKRAKSEYPDPSLIELADINMKKFQSDFPQDPRIEKMQSSLVSLKATFADELYKMARFYEYRGKSQAAYIYYKTIVAKYPDTRFGPLATKGIQRLQKSSKDQKQFQL